MPPSLTITLTGDIAVEADGRRLRDESLGPRGRIVLALLVLERHRLVSPDELADAAWGYDLPPTWRSALRGVITRLRRFLELSRMEGAVSLVNRLGCYQLTLPPGTKVDVEEARAEYEAARRDYDVHAYAEATAAASKAAQLCGKDFLPGAKGMWAEAQQSQVRALHLDSLELLATSAIECGEAVLASQAARELLTTEPYRETAYVLLMKALARSGNVSEAMRNYQRCCDVLERELGASPSPATHEAYLSLLSDSRAQPSGKTSIPTATLPLTASAFIGRKEELIALEEALTSTRLLTLTGTAGIGKTRLATELARTLVSRFPDGVWFTDLAAITTSAVRQHVRSVLKLPDAPGEDVMEGLCRHVAERQSLLILDNCEHVVAECAHLARSLLRAGPMLTVLATSREPLHVPGEAVWEVPPLSVPASVETAPNGDPLRHEAVQLFADRAHLVDPNPTLDIAAAAEICARLDGIPLAIELAAARTRVFSLRELATRLEHRLSLLTQPAHGVPTRHRSLEAALDWSHQLLEPAESTLFRRLAVFSGGFTAKAAETVCAEDGFDVVGALCGLVEKSLVMAERRTPCERFRQLETVRAYGLARLSRSAEEARVRNRHLDWALRLAESAAADIDGKRQSQSLGALEAEHENLRAALEWATQSNQEGIGLRLAVALARFWEIRGDLTEGRAWLERLARQQTGDPSLRATALNAAGVLAHDQCDYPSARSLHDQAVRIRRSLGDTRGVAASLNGLANVAVSEGELPTARRLFEEVLRIGDQLRDKQIMAASLMNVAVVIQHAVEHGVEAPDALSEASVRLKEAMALQRELGDLHGIALSLENLGVLSALEGNSEFSRANFNDCLELYRALGDKKGVAGTARFLGQLCYRDGDLSSARTLLEECLRIERELGSSERVAEALGFLGRIEEGTGDVRAARRLFQEGLATYAKGGNPNGADDLLRRLGELEARCDASSFSP